MKSKIISQRVGGSVCMLLSDIEKDPWKALDYLERQVNDGSKSGFTQKHNTSIQTNPFSSEGFNILKLIPREKCIEQIGLLNDDSGLFADDNSIFIHPDWLLPQNRDSILKIGSVEKGVWVVPTSSSRTVHVDKSNIYIKLHYPGVIGRLNRVLGFRQLIAGIEISDIFDRAQQNKEMPDYFDYMSESYGKLLREGENEIGYIVRKMPSSIQKYYLIPGFSLFSADHSSPEDAQLLIQILEKNNNPEKYFIEDICFRLIDVFFWCVVKEGLIPEMHSQNIVFAFDRKWRLKKIILRDFESIDKDISIRRRLGKSSDFREYPFKCISNNDFDYLKRHSFMYDHKFGEYLLDPLVECAAKLFKCPVRNLQEKLRTYVKETYRSAIDDFFPNDGYWYKYPNIEIDRSTKRRPFMAIKNPVYR